VHQWLIWGCLVRASMMRIATAVWLAACSATVVSGHGMMTVPEPRPGTTVAGKNKRSVSAPCGRGRQLRTQGPAVATYTAGDSLQVFWKITIPHGGTCRISLTTQGKGVPDAVDGQGRLDENHPDVHKLSPDFPCGKAAGMESRQVKIPESIYCDNCVLQWFWTGDGPYYVCADVSVMARATEGRSMLKYVAGIGALLIVAAALIYFWRKQSASKGYQKMHDEGPGHHGSADHFTAGQWMRVYAAAGCGKLGIFTNEAAYSSNGNPIMSFKAGEIHGVSIAGEEPGVVVVETAQGDQKLRLAEPRQAWIWAAAIGRLKDDKAV